MEVKTADVKIPGLARAIRVTAIIPAMGENKSVIVRLGDENGMLPLGEDGLLFFPKGSAVVPLGEERQGLAGTLEGESAGARDTRYRMREELQKRLCRSITEKCDKVKGVLLLDSDVLALPCFASGTEAKNVLFESIVALF